MLDTDTVSFALRGEGGVARWLLEQKPIGGFDTLIAAHALACDLVLVTNNVKHFGTVPGLRIENWL